MPKKSTEMLCENSKLQHMYSVILLYKLET